MARLYLFKPLMLFLHPLLQLRIQSRIVQSVVKAMLMSNNHERIVVNPITLGLITSKMKTIPHLNFRPERLKQEIETNGDSFISMMHTCLQHMQNMNVDDRETCRIDEEDLIFQYQPKILT
jgi:hypothetical protein